MRLGCPNGPTQQQPNQHIVVTGAHAGGGRNAIQEGRARTSAGGAPIPTRAIHRGYLTSRQIVGWPPSERHLQNPSPAPAITEPTTQHGRGRPASYGSTPAEAAAHCSMTGPPGMPAPPALPGPAPPVLYFGLVVRMETMHDLMLSTFLKLWYASSCSLSCGFEFEWRVGGF